ncbi:uncharacterized protein LOC131240489 isoform X3 [Magnolia sinica]|uniref:uncharacterized protein LOC131240489 isoform X3 n=1 Tax=Magnolia sinica TaxID=86752 RepID=UPI002659CA02|nr:uncharacterized protein LOC131240489 isoform X3 [Magnolia sinica]
MPHEIPMISLRAGKWTMPSDSDDLSYLAGESESMVELPLCKTCSRFRGMDLSAEYFVHALGLQELEEAEIEMDLLQKDQALHEVSGSSKEEAHWTPDSPLLSTHQNDDNHLQEIKDSIRSLQVLKVLNCDRL